METNRKPRNYYTDEYKREAVERCHQVGVTKASEELGINMSSLIRWRRQFSDSSNKISNNKSVSKPSYEELEKENLRLKKELGYVEEINRVLKKSTAIFSSKEMGGFK